MRNMLRKVSVFLASLFMVAVTLAPLKVQATEAKVEEHKVVYAKVPETWESPCIWAWDQEGNNAFSAWPGGELERDQANEGWYYGFVPFWADHVIINGKAAGEEVQTAEQILQEGDVWLTVVEDLTAEISYQPLTQGQLPEYVETFVIHASVPDSWEAPNLWAWLAPDGTNAFSAWPGEAMTQKEDGWYAAKAPVWVNSIIINANEGEVQTEDLTIDPAELWVTVTEDGTADFTYNDPNQADIPDITVYVKAPKDWEAPCLWAWSAPDGTNAFSAWPGEALTEGENGWLTIQVPGWVNSLIVNANEGSVQTSDISVDTGKDVWLVVEGPKSATATYEEPQVTEEPSKETGQETENPDSAPKAAQPEETAEKSNTGLILGIAAAVIAIVIVVAVVVTKRKQK